MWALPLLGVLGVLREATAKQVSCLQMVEAAYSTILWGVDASDGELTCILYSFRLHMHRCPQHRISAPTPLTVRHIRSVLCRNEDEECHILYI
jgi:hypothetical protein